MVAGAKRRTERGTGGAPLQRPCPPCPPRGARAPPAGRQGGKARRLPGRGERPERRAPLGPRHCARSGRAREGGARPQKEALGEERRRGVGGPSGEGRPTGDGVRGTQRRETRRPRDAGALPNGRATTPARAGRDEQARRPNHGTRGAGEAGAAARTHKGKFGFPNFGR